MWRADVAQSVEHVLGKDGVSGSIPLIGSRVFRRRMVCAVRVLSVAFRRKWLTAIRQFRKRMLLRPDLGGLRQSGETLKIH